MTSDGTFREDTAVEGMPYEIIDDVPTSEVSVFVGWKIDGSDGTLTGGDSLTPDGDTVLTAQWRDRYQYDVVYISDGDELLRETAYEGIPYVIANTIPEKDDGIFVAWQDADGEQHTAGNSIDISADRTLTAVWREVAEHTVVFVDAEGNEHHVTVEDGESLTIDIEEPADADRIFLGWSVNGSDELVHTGDMTSDGTFREDTAVEGIAYTIADDVPVSGDRIFDGWMADAFGPVMFGGDEIVLEGDTIFTAQWRERESYDVVYMSEGSEFLRDTAYEGVSYTIIAVLTSSLGDGDGIRGMVWRFCLSCPIALVVFWFCIGVQLRRC